MNHDGTTGVGIPLGLRRSWLMALLAIVVGAAALLVARRARASCGQPIEVATLRIESVRVDGRAETNLSVYTHHRVDISPANAAVILTVRDDAGMAIQEERYVSTAVRDR